MQIKTTMRYHLSPLSTVIIIGTGVSAGKTEKLDPSYVVYLMH